METSHRTTTTETHAFRIVRGDVIRLNGALYTVTGVEQMVRYSRDRNNPLPESERHGVKITARPKNPRRRFAHVSLGNFDTIRVAR